ncbi:MAG: Gfo/Idh/MocA family oxidoreductase [Bryobacteraceae bacterium]|nr:Gfo/Idh/MocA family oxidoreductase [Bryobacteraceae bacterium]
MSSYSRRAFLGAAGGAAFAARSYSQVSGAGNRLRIGVIGCGGMATHHMKTLVPLRESDNFEFAAVCDIYDKRARMAAELTGAKIHKDYRSLLEEKDIDYVLIATPEHWHAQMTIDAAEAGKHIYCEKPMTQTSEQAKKVVAVIQRTGVKMQVGVQGMSDDSYETANKYVKQDALGKVVLAQIDYSRNYAEDFWDYEIDGDARPGENLDWSAWLGPAPRRPFEPERFFRWRHYWDYSSGIASDLFVHRVTRIIKSLDLTFPDRGVATGGKFFFVNSKAEVPDTMNVLLDYPEGLTVQLISSMANDARVEHMLRGHKATLFFTPTGFEIRPQELFEKELKPVVHEKSGGERVDLHHRNLMNAIRHNEPLKCDCRLGYYGVVACEMGTQSLRRQKYMAWDRGRERLRSL